MKDMLKLPPLANNPTLAQIIRRMFKLIVERSGGYIEITPNADGNKIGLRAIMKDGEYTLDLSLTQYSSGTYLVSNFSSVEKDGDQGAPNWMPAEWTPILSLKRGERWKIEKGSDVVALFEAHTKWSKFEGYYTVFEGKDKNI